MKELLAIYLIKHHGFSDAESLSILGAYGGLVYAGRAFVQLRIGNNTVTHDALGSLWWIVLAYLLIEIGEVALASLVSLQSLHDPCLR